MLLALQLAASLGAASLGPLEVRSGAVDPARTEAGLRARTGDALDGFSIAVDDAPEPGAVDVRLRAPDGEDHTRRITLLGDTVEDRSRELAASLALLMEAEGRPPPAPAPPAPAPPPPIRGWLALGPRLELGASILAEAGADLQGGAWLAREHVQPILSAGFTGAAQDGITVLHARFGGGLAIGAPLRDRRIWLGGHVLAHALWARARELGTATAWLSSTEIGALAQYRGRRLFLGLRTGVDLTLPPLSVRGTQGRIRRGPVRWIVGLVIGLVFG